MENLKGKKEKYLLAVIGAGEGGFPILKKARELDYVRTIAFGQHDSLAKDYADTFITCDINNIETIVGICKEKGVDGVIGTSESTTEITARIAYLLGLPGNDIKTGFAARDKYVMRQHVAERDCVRQPKFGLFKEDEEYSYPVVVKAVDSCGKRGISVVKRAGEMANAVAYARKYSTNGDVLVEEYLDGGKEYSIECLVSEDICEIVQYTEKESSGPPHFVETAHHQPADLTGQIRKKINDAVPEILNAVGIKCGLAHLELKVIDGEVYFIEVGARGGGDHIADTLTVKSTDFDYFKAAIDSCLGIYKHVEINNIAYTGIYFHSSQNQYLRPLFMAAKKSDWCLVDTTSGDDFMLAESNVDTAHSGYIIYCSDHKITLKDAE